MQNLEGKALLAILLLLAIYLREDFLSQTQPDHYLFPVKSGSGIKFQNTESSDLNYLPDNTNTYIVLAVSDMDYFGLQLCSKISGMRQVTVLSDVNLCNLNGNTGIFFSDCGYLHLLTLTNDTLVFQKNTTNWLPESARVVGDSVILANDTARVTVPVYRK